MNTRIIPLVFVIALGCGKKDKRPDGELTTDIQHTTEAGPPVHADPGPALERRTGALPPLVRQVVQAQVTHLEVTGDHVLATVPLSMDKSPGPNPSTKWVVEADGRHGAAVSFDWDHVPRDGSSGHGVIVRMPGKSLPPKFTLRWTLATNYYSDGPEPGMMGTVEVATPAKPATSKGLEVHFWNALARSFENVRRGSGFHRYAAQRARYFADPKRTIENTRDPNFQRQSDLQRQMDLYSGMTSVNEALQSDRALLLRAEPPSERKLAVGDIKRLELEPHPWDDMIAELGATPKLEPLAASIPADMAYLHFGDMRTFVKLISDLDDWVSPVAQWIEGRAGASHFMSRYEEQLILERTGVAETLGHLAVSELAVLASDPFLREGTDVSMVFRVANKPALLTALSAFEADARRRHDDLKVEKTKIAGIDVERRFTPGLVVNQYRAQFGDVLVLSNSPAAVERIAKAHAGKAPRLSDQGDFRYMRTLYPYSKDEAGFAFLGDAFVERVVSPEVKILEVRRMAARADLLAINHAALLRGWVDGEMSTSLKDLTASKYLTPAEVRHADGGEIVFDAELGAQSPIGRVAQLRPILDTKIDKVSQAEVDAYDRFRDTYETYWRNYIDPIAAQIGRSSDGRRLSVDARMLPLIDATDYRDLIRQVGKKKIMPARRGPGVEWTLAIGDDAKLRRELDGLAKGFIPGNNIGIEWLGDWVSFGAADRGGLWDMALITGMIPSVEDERRGMQAGLEVLSSFPVYAAVDVDSSIGLAALLTGLKKWVSDSAPGMVTWGASEPYRDVPIVTIAGNQREGELRDVAVHYATVNNVFVISFNRPTLLTLIDRYLAGDGPELSTGPPSAAGPQDTQATFSLDASEAGWLTKTLLGIAESEIIRHHPGVVEDVEVLWRATGSVESIRERGVAFLGYEPRSPHGGTFSVVDGFPTHSLYGDLIRPVIPPVPIEGSPVSDVLTRVQRLNMTVEFDGEAEHQGLHTTIEWVWKEE